MPAVMSTAPFNQAPLDLSNDDDDDQDYIPPTRNSDSDNDEERPAKRIKQDQDPEEKPLPAIDKKAQDALFSEFKASAASSASHPPSINAQPKLISIVKKYRFAGQEITEVVKVSEDSDDARKWPRQEDVETKTDPSSSTQLPSSLMSPNQIQSSSSKTAPPRRKKTQLLSSTSKPKKLTTLDKSAMDWAAHVNQSSSKDELEANRRGGRYLEKVDFLKRVQDRKEDVLEAEKNGKRRR